MQQKAQRYNALKHGDEGSLGQFDVPEPAGLEGNVYVCNALSNHSGRQIVSRENGSS